MVRESQKCRHEATLTQQCRQFSLPVLVDQTKWQNERTGAISCCTMQPTHVVQDGALSAVSCQPVVCSLAIGSWIFRQDVSVWDKLLMEIKFLALVLICALLFLEHFQLHAVLHHLCHLCHQQQTVLMTSQA